MMQQESMQLLVRRWWRDPSWVAALGAVLLGVSALVVSVYQSLLMHEQQRISVWPHLLHGNHWQRDDSGAPLTYAYSVRNAGIGPARIRFVQVAVDGTPVTSWNQAMAALGLQDTDRVFFSTLSNTVIPAGDVVRAMQWENTPELNKLQSLQQRLSVTVCYCSVYDECQLSGEALDWDGQQCPAAERQVFHD